MLQKPHAHGTVAFTRKAKATNEFSLTCDKQFAITVFQGPCPRHRSALSQHITIQGHEDDAEQDELARMRHGSWRTPNSPSDLWHRWAEHKPASAVITVHGGDELHGAPRAVHAQAVHHPAVGEQTTQTHLVYVLLNI